MPREILVVTCTDLIISQICSYGFLLQSNAPDHFRAVQIWGIMFLKLSHSCAPKWYLQAGNAAISKNILEEVDDDGNLSDLFGILPNNCVLLTHENYLESIKRACKKARIELQVRSYKGTLSAA